MAPRSHTVDFLPLGSVSCAKGAASTFRAGSGSSRILGRSVMPARSARPALCNQRLAVLLPCRASNMATRTMPAIIRSKSASRCIHSSRNSATPAVSCRGRASSPWGLLGRHHQLAGLPDRLLALQPPVLGRLDGVLDLAADHHLVAVLAAGHHHDLDRPALAVDGGAGLLDLATLPRRRGRGLGLHILHALDLTGLARRELQRLLLLGRPLPGGLDHQ